MRLYKDHLNSATLEIDGALTSEILQMAIDFAQSDPAGVWYVNLIIDPDVARAHQALLNEFEFTVAGSSTASARTTLTLRRNIKRSQDGNRASFSPSGCISTVQRPTTH
jgi:hypothetical protein